MLVRESVSAKLLNATKDLLPYRYVMIGEVLKGRARHTTYLELEVEDRGHLQEGTGRFWR